jgi:hypothetical protein
VRDELVDDDLGERDGAVRRPRLRGTNPADGVGVLLNLLVDADGPAEEVDVPAFEPQNLALSQPAPTQPRRSTLRSSHNPAPPKRYARGRQSVLTTEGCQ